MRRGYMALALVLIAISLSFYAGRTACTALGALEVPRTEPVHAEPVSYLQRKTPTSPEAEATGITDRARIDEIASVSFARLWEVMRSASPARRAVWANELQSMLAGTKQNAAIQTFYMVWVDLDAASAIKSVEAMQNKRLRDLAVSAMQAAASEPTLPLLAEMQERLGYRGSSFYPGDVFSRWGAANPAEAAEFLSAHADMNSGFYYNLSWSWGNVDPEKAASWFLNLKLAASVDPKFPRALDKRRLEAARGFLQSWMDLDRHAAATFVSNHVADPQIGEALPEFTHSLCARSREDATAFVLSIPDENLQKAALDDVFRQLQPMMMIREGGDDEEPPEPELAATDAAPWIVSLPQRLWVERAGEILAHWSGTDAAAADRWFQSLSDETQIKTIDRYCGTASTDQATTIVRMLQFIPDRRKRDQLLQFYVQAAGDNPEDLEARLTALPLSDGQKRQLRQRVRTRQ